MWCLHSVFHPLRCVPGFYVLHHQESHGQVGFLSNIRGHSGAGPGGCGYLNRVVCDINPKGWERGWFQGKRDHSKEMNQVGAPQGMTLFKGCYEGPQQYKNQLRELG